MSKYSTGIDKVNFRLTKNNGWYNNISIKLSSARSDIKFKLQATTSPADKILIEAYDKAIEKQMDELRRYKDYPDLKKEEVLYVIGQSESLLETVEPLLKHLDYHKNAMAEKEDKEKAKALHMQKLRNAKAATL
ncbi:MAG: hypothetical protein FWF97_01210 [Alphaproteobacteria bacterium]|nr:hypothetical protein [Alphaproteobacteria bacterium]